MGSLTQIRLTPKCLRPGDLLTVPFKNPPHSKPVPAQPEVRVRLVLVLVSQVLGTSR